MSLKKKKKKKKKKRVLIIMIIGPSYVLLDIIIIIHESCLILTILCLVDRHIRPMMSTQNSIDQHVKGEGTLPVFWRLDESPSFHVFDLSFFFLSSLGLEALEESRYIKKDEAGF